MYGNLNWRYFSSPRWDHQIKSLTKLCNSSDGFCEVFIAPKLPEASAPPTIKCEWDVTCHFTSQVVKKATSVKNQAKSGEVVSADQSRTCQKGSKLHRLGNSIWYRASNLKALEHPMTFDMQCKWLVTQKQQGIYMDDSGRAFRALRFARHRGPNHVSKYINGPIKAHMLPSRTYVHPGFNASRIVFITAIRPAPKEQRTRLFCSVIRI